MNKIILLGASRIRIPCVISARKLGCRVVTCDYLSDNPGHRFSD